MRGDSREHRWRRLVRRAFGVAIVAVTAFALAGIPLYVFPREDSTDGIDAIYVIGPPTNERMEVVRALRDANFDGDVLVTVGKVGWGWSWPSVPECVDRTVTCVVPHPFTTFGEAATLNTWAADHEAEDVLVVTFTPHVTRTRLIFERCFSGTVRVVGVDENLNGLEWTHQYLYQSAALTQVPLTDCPTEPTGGLEVVR